MSIQQDPVDATVCAQSHSEPVMDIPGHERRVCEGNRSSGAIFSADYRRRLLLWRAWSEDPIRVLVYLGINPSTAGAEHDDPTVKRTIAFAKRIGLGGVVFANAFTLISSSPRHMLADRDPVGPLADWALRCALGFHGQVFAAWGKPNPQVARRCRGVEALAQEMGVTLWCFGTNGDGSPRHIMARGRHRVPDDQEPIIYCEPPARQPRAPGGWKWQVMIADDFDAPLPKYIEDAFYDSPITPRNP